MVVNHRVIRMLNLYLPSNALVCRFLLGVAYPTYESFKAIETTGTKDDTQVNSVVPAPLALDYSDLACPATNTHLTRLTPL